MSFDLYPWQIEDGTLLASKHRWLLANEMRTGKTGAALYGAHRLKAKRVGVICPAIVVRDWPNAAKDFGLAFPHFAVASYERFTRHGAALKDFQNLDVLICDEDHYLKSPDAKRTLAIYGNGADEIGMMRVPYVWGLSGTPAPNHVGEYYTRLKAWGLTTLRHWQFLERYCIIEHTPYGYRITGNRKETLPELRALLARMMSRRTQRSVWKETPEPFWSIRTMTPTAADAKLLLELDAQFDVLASVPNPMRDGRGELARVRRQLGLLKVPYVVSHVTDLLQNAQVPKVLLGAWHTDVIDKLRTALAPFHPIVVQGDTSEKMRWELRERFQTAPTCRLAIVQMKTGGVGISLSSAAHVVIAEPDWGRDVNEQFVQRPQHIARTVPLPVDLLTMADSLDETILRANVRKRKIDAEVSSDAPASGAMAEPSLDVLLGVTNGTPFFIDDL